MFMASNTRIVIRDTQDGTTLYIWYYPDGFEDILKTNGIEYSKEDLF
jgi:hypothetical protein